MDGLIAGITLFLIWFKGKICDMFGDMSEHGTDGLIITVGSHGSQVLPCFLFGSGRIPTIKCPRRRAWLPPSTESSPPSIGPG